MTTSLIASAFVSLEGNGTLDNRLVYWLSLDKWSIDEAAKVMSNIIPDQSSINANEEFSSVTLFTGQQIPSFDDEGNPITYGDCVEYIEGCECWKLNKSQLLKYTGLFNDVRRLLARAFQDEAYLHPITAIDLIVSKDVAIPWLNFAVTNKLMPTKEDLGTQSTETSRKNSSRPPYQQRHQEIEILRVIGELGYDATNLPPRNSGKRWVKAQVRDVLEFPVKVFDKAWERLRTDGRIKD